MEGNSKGIYTHQIEPDSRLLSLVDKHRDHIWQKPFSPHSLRAAETVFHWISKQPSHKIILDSGCGTGQSTALLAEREPTALVIGIDRSEARLNRFSNLTASQNMLLIRGNVEDLWRIFAAEGLAVHEHYLLYPNPYPKTSQLQMRWHGHPVFPILSTLSPIIKLRSNWKLYLEEFALAYRHLNPIAQTALEPCPNENLTLFETKYANSGQDLWRLTLKRGKL